jgi:xanthine/CO dehydrogenase XdhC/CoxF family maturation factor
VTGFVDLARAAQAARVARPDVPLALATLVQVDGSSYRQPGARLLVDAEGRVLAGAVSGGCLEGDVAARAAEVCASGRALRLMYDLRTDLEAIWGFGARCDGVAHLLLEPLPDWRWMAQAESVRSRRQGGAVVTVLDARGGGATCALLDGEVRSGRWHTLHDASRLLSTADLAPLVQASRRTGHAVLQPLSDDVTVFVEPLVAAVALHCVGAGRGAEAFARIATTLGWQVTVLDHRPALLDELQLPEAVARRRVAHTDGVQLALTELPHDDRTAVALLTHIFDVDVAWLTATLSLPLAYVGVLGSRQRARQLMEQATQQLLLRGTPLTARQQHKLHAPIGLDLGGETPASIALAAIAEIEAVIHARPAGFLRERQSPIHARTPTPELLAGDAARTLADQPLRCDLPEFPAG